MQKLPGPIYVKIKLHSVLHSCPTWDCMQQCARIFFVIVTTWNILHVLCQVSKNLVAIINCMNSKKMHFLFQLVHLLMINSITLQLVLNEVHAFFKYILRENDNREFSFKYICDVTSIFKSWFNLSSYGNFLCWQKVLLK